MKPKTSTAKTRRRGEEGRGKREEGREKSAGANPTRLDATAANLRGGGASGGSGGSGVILFAGREWLCLSGGASGGSGGSGVCPPPRRVEGRKDGPTSGADTGPKPGGTAEDVITRILLAAQGLPQWDITDAVEWMERSDPMASPFVLCAIIKHLLELGWAETVLAVSLCTYRLTPRGESVAQGRQIAMKLHGPGGAQIAALLIRKLDEAIAELKPRPAAARPLIANRKSRVARAAKVVANG